MVVGVVIVIGAKVCLFVDWFVGVVVIVVGVVAAVVAVVAVVVE